MALAPREGRRPERHQPIADKLVDNAVADVDGRRHLRKVGVKQLDQRRGGQQASRAPARRCSSPRSAPRNTLEAGSTLDEVAEPNLKGWPAFKAADERTPH